MRLRMLALHIMFAVACLSAMGHHTVTVAGMLAESRQTLAVAEVR
jgi:hypothetical protein